MLDFNNEMNKFNEGEIDLDELIKSFGRHDIIFEIQYKNEETRYYIMCDKNDIEKYVPSYKIYLMSTDLRYYRNYYISDIEDIIRNSDRFRLKIRIHYRYDVLKQNELL